MSEIKQPASKSHVLILSWLGLLLLLGFLLLLLGFLLVLFLFVLLAGGLASCGGWGGGSTAAELLDTARDELVEGFALERCDDSVEVFVVDAGGDGGEHCLDVGGGCVITMRY